MFKGLNGLVLKPIGLFLGGRNIGGHFYIYVFETIILKNGWGTITMIYGIISYGFQSTNLLCGFWKIYI